MAKWEYLVIRLVDAQFDRETLHTMELKKYSDWELVSVVGNLAYLKRLAIEMTHPQYVDVAQLETLVRRIIGEEFELDKK